MSESRERRPLQDRGAKLISASLMAVAGGIMLAIGDSKTGGLAAGLGAVFLIFGSCAWITTWFRRYE